MFFFTGPSSVRFHRLNLLILRGPAAAAVFFCCAAALGQAPAGGAPPAGEAAAVVLLEVPFAPIPVKTGRGVVLAYELSIANRGAQDIALRSVEAIAEPEYTFFQYSEQELAAHTVCFDAQWNFVDFKTAGGLKPGWRAIVFVWIEVGAASLPAEGWQHRVGYAELGIEGAAAGKTVKGAETKVSPRQPVPISAVLRGGGWLAFRGPAPDSEHWRRVIPFDGTPFCSQRFAADWMRFGPTGRLYDGEPSANSNWFGYGAEVLAAGDGTVHALQDNIPENTPLAPEKAVPITPETVMGNMLILKLDQGVFAVYGHLQPGSFKVKAGERVSAGAVLARVGNSGSAAKPHLHFHVADSPDLFKAQGLPFVVKRFALQGQVPPDAADGQTPWRPGPAATNGAPVELEMPLGLSVIDFSH